jgi:hypothetical protein
VARDSQVTGIGSTGPMYFAPFAPSGRTGRPPVILLPSAMASIAVAAVHAADARAATEAIPLSEQADRSLGDSKGMARMGGALGLLGL